MQRRTFIKTCCAGCLGGMSLFLSACGAAAPHYAAFTAAGRRLAVAKDEFQFTTPKGAVRARAFVLLRPQGASFPIGLFHGADGSYTACLLKCTHQACEVEVQGSRYACPCHGSEFDARGQVLNGPADQPLSTFKTEEDAEHVFILLD